MKAISLWQPWASLIGIKRNETRHWSTRHRGAIAIHAAQRFQREERAFAERPEIAKLLAPLTIHTVPLGAIVALAQLDGCVRVETIRDSLSPTELLLGNYDDDRWAWMFSHFVLLTHPIPYKGRQGLFDIPDTLVRDHLNATREPRPR
jgi:hypothetical protein